MIYYISLVNDNSPYQNCFTWFIGLSYIIIKINIIYNIIIFQKHIFIERICPRILPGWSNINFVWFAVTLIFSD